MSNTVLDLEKNTSEILKKIWQKQISKRICPKSNQVIKPDQRDIATKFCSDW